VKKALFAFFCLSLFVLGCKKEEVAAPVATEEVAVAAADTTVPADVAASTETVPAVDAQAVAK